MGFKDDCTKGDWSSGLFDIKCPLCCFNYLCAPCSSAQISEKLGNPGPGCSSKPVACLAACCGCNICLIFIFGSKSKDAGKGAVGFLKTWCCGICYLHQQYKEHGCPEDIGTLVGTSFKPAQTEMS